MPEFGKLNPAGKLRTDQPHILIGITSPQTCLVLSSRLRALREAGFRVSLLSTPGALLDQTAKAEGVAAFALPMSRGIKLREDCISFLRMLRLLLFLKPDIVEFSTPKAGFLGSLAAFLCRVPLRIYFLRGLKLETSSGLKRLFLLWIECASARCAHLVLCNSPSLRERASALGIAPLSKLVLLGEGSSNGVDITRFSPGLSSIRQQLGIPPYVPVIGFVGRLTVDKGLPELLEAFTAILRQVPNARLLLVGWFDAAEDVLEHRLRARVEGHPHIILTGLVRDTAPYYRAMDVMVLPSWREGFPNAVLEAAATGVPVVSTLCTGARDAVVPEVTGFLVPPGYPEAICEAVLPLVRDPELRQRMSRASRAWVETHFQDRRLLDLTVDFYERLINTKSAKGFIALNDRSNAPSGLTVLP